MDKVKFGQRLRTAREAKALTAQEAADQIGLANSQYYSRYERAERLPPYDKLLQICAVFDITPNYLFSDDLPSSEDFDEKLARLNARDKGLVESLMDNLLKNDATYIQFKKDEI